MATFSASGGRVAAPPLFSPAIPTPCAPITAHRIISWCSYTCSQHTIGSPIKPPCINYGLSYEASVRALLTILPLLCPGSFTEVSGWDVDSVAGWLDLINQKESVDAFRGELRRSTPFLRRPNSRTICITPGCLDSLVHMVGLRQGRRFRRISSPVNGRCQTAFARRGPARQRER